jgi:mannose-6-phosphate isomerase-like protein (cupin superfamily)
MVEPGRTRSGASLLLPNGKIDVKLLSGDTGDRMTVVEQESEGGPGPPLHVHYESDEWFYVLQGEMVFEMDGKQHYADTGTSLLVPMGTPHRFSNIGAKPSRILFAYSPRNGMEKYFAEAVAFRTANPNATREQVNVLWAKYKGKVLGDALLVKDVTVRRSV